MWPCKKITRKMSCSSSINLRQFYNLSTSWSKYALKGISWKTKTPSLIFHSDFRHSWRQKHQTRHQSDSNPWYPPTRTAYRYPPTDTRQQVLTGVLFITQLQLLLHGHKKSLLVHIGVSTSERGHEELDINSELYVRGMGTYTPVSLTVSSR